jgi:hypothetical protein
MSDTTATLREKNRQGRHLDIFWHSSSSSSSFLFGMPRRFWEQKSKIDAYNAAKVGSDFLTKGEVAEYQKRLEDRMSQKHEGASTRKSRKMFEDMTRGRALDEAIDRKVFYAAAVARRVCTCEFDRGRACSPLSTRSSFQKYICEWQTRHRTPERIFWASGA